MDLGFPVWLCATHFLNLLFMTLMARSGLEILSAFPKLYVSDDCPPGHELVRFSKKSYVDVKPGTIEPLWTSLDEEESWPSWIALPGRKNLGLGRHWHFMTLQFWILTGVIYVLFLIVSGQWVRIVPNSWDIFPEAMKAISIYLLGHLAPARPGLPYNAAQQLAYFFVIFILSPFQILTGAAMSPAIIAQFPRYTKLFGGKQGARTLHFIGLCLFGGFVAIHTLMVIIHGVPREWAAIVLTSYQANHTVAVAVGLLGLAFIGLVNWIATDRSLHQPRLIQRLTGILVDPFESAISRVYTSKQRYTTADVSPYFRINGYPPKDAEYERLAAKGFRDYRLRVYGLVNVPLELSLDDLRKMGCVKQITKHNCIQGWTATAEWGGVPLHQIVHAAAPYSWAKHIVLHAYDNKSITGEEPRYHGEFYGTIPIHLADNAQTILAIEMNGQPLPVEHGGPVRLRVETQLGFKMVKWIKAIEFVEDYRNIGDGQGGWREDQQYYANWAGI